MNYVIASLVVVAGIAALLTMCYPCKPDIFEQTYELAKDKQ